MGWRRMEAPAGSDNVMTAYIAVPKLTFRYNRGWRYHIETQLWLFATSLAAMDGSDPSLIDTPPRWLKGPFVYFDPRTLTRDRMPDDYMINHNLIELTRPAGERQRTRGLEVHVDSSESSGSTRVGR